MARVVARRARRDVERVVCAVRMVWRRVVRAWARSVECRGGSVMAGSVTGLSFVGRGNGGREGDLGRRLGL